MDPLHVELVTTLQMVRGRDGSTQSRFHLTLRELDPKLVYCSPVFEAV